METIGDKYLKVGANRAEFICGLRDYLGSHRDNYDMSNLINNYLNKPAKPTLTEDEKVILRNIRDFEIPKDNVQTIIIGNNKAFGGLYIEFIYNYDNGKGTTGVGMHKEEFRLFNHLFQFIQPRRRI